MKYKTIQFMEGPYCIRVIEDPQDYAKAFLLRHKIFCEELGWIPCVPYRLEIDEHDMWATSLGVFSPAGSLLGLVRLLPPERPFMLEREFATLVPPDYEIRKGRDTAEVTRFIAGRGIPGHGPYTSHIAALIYKALYQWSLRNDIRYLYFVVNKKFLRALRLSGFPCELIGPLKPLQAEVDAVAVSLDWEAYRRRNQRHKKQRLHWMSRIQSRPDSTQLRPHETESMH